MKLEYKLDAKVELLSPFDGEQFNVLKATLVSVMLHQKDVLFKRSMDPDGNPWKKLSAGTISTKNKKIKDKKKKGMHQILVDTGALKNSITSSSDPYGIRGTQGNDVEIGTNIPYASIHNFGGIIIVPANDNGFGRGIHIPEHKVTIPARPFMGFGGSDLEEIAAVVTAHIDRAVHG